MRTWKSNPFVGLALLVVISGAGWLTYRTVKGPAQVVNYSYVLMCTNPDCGEIFQGSYPENEEPPFPCPVCGSPAYPALRCRACGAVFPSLKSPSQRAPYSCPECRKGTAFPLEPGQLNRAAPPSR